MTAGFDSDALVAVVDLVHRTGARNFEVGHLDDTPLVQDARWYAHAQYRGARITVEDQPGPDAAADALAARLLDGGRCQACGGFTTTSTEHAVRVPKRSDLMDGTTRTSAEVAKVGFCRWRRIGDRWRRDCDGGPHQPAGERPAGPNRAARRRNNRRKP